MKKTIFLNAGHSVNDPGAIYNKKKEAEEAMAIRTLLVPLLQKSGFEVLTVPDNLNLTNSIKRVNQHMKNLEDGMAFSIHLNAGGGTGAEIFYYAGSNPSKEYAETMIDEYCKELTLTNRGAKADISTRHKRLGWVRDVNPWSFLIEVGFIDSESDMKIISNHERVAEALNQAICKMYGVEPVIVESKESKIDKIIEDIKKDLNRVNNKLNEIVELNQ